MKKILDVILVFVLCLIITGCGCSKQKITVTFDTNSDTKISSQTIEKGNVISKPSNPTKEGYIFDGWYYNGKKFDFDTKITEDIVLEAKWLKNDKKKYTITFQTDRNSEVSSIQVEEGTLVGNLPTPKKEGYKFVGWYNNNELVTSNTKITEDITLVAKWEKETKKTTKKKTTKVATNKNSTTTTKPSTTKPTTKVNTTTKPSTTKPTTKVNTTTKPSTTKPTTTAAVELSWTVERYKNSDVGQGILYLLKNDEKVTGTCTIVTSTNEVINNVKISASGELVDSKFVVDVKNIKVD